MHQLSARSSHASAGRRHRHRAARAGWWLHLAGAIALIVGLFLPLTSAGQALAAPSDTGARVMAAQSDSDTVPPAPAQVTAVGDFQQALGCAAFDASCQTTQLTNHAGIWTGVFAVPPGQYQWQIQAVAPDGTTYTYGQGGLGGGAQSVTVGDGDAGLYFSLDTHTNSVAAAPVAGLYSVNVDGASVALQPAGGQLVALVSSPGGTASVQVYSGADPLGGPQQAQLSQGPNRLTFSLDGQLLNVETLQGGSVTIERLDANGTPLPGGCYQLRSGGSIVNQGCDADDGADGYTSMSFPTGVPGGAVTVVEVTPPDGAEPIGDQQLDLTGGDMLVTLQPESVVEETPTETATEIETPTETVTATAEETETPATRDLPVETETAEGGAPGDLIVNLQDQNGAPIGGACWQLLQNGAVVAESCDAEPFDPADFANNGATGFFGVPSGTYTLRLFQAPGGATADDREVTVQPGQQVSGTVTAEVPATEAPIETETPTEEPTETPTEEILEPATFTVQLRDQNGAPVGGACWQLIRDGAVAAESCDTTDWESPDFANNGNTGFFDVEPGAYTLHYVSGPEGVSVVDRQVEIAPGSDDAVEVTVDIATPTETATATNTPEPQPGDLVITLQDQSGAPIGGACWQLLRDGAVVAESCDTTSFESDQFANNGNTGFNDLPAGTYTLRLAAAPDGVSVDDREVTVQPGGDDTVVVQATLATPTETATATETATEEPTASPTEEDAEPGNLTVTLVDGNNQPIGGACWVLLQDGSVIQQSCDTTDWESAQFANNGNTGFFDMPAGDYTLQLVSAPEGVSVEDRDVEIAAGGDDTVVVTAQVAATETPAEDATETPTEEATEPEPGPPGNLIVTLQDENGAPIGGACFQIAMAGQPPIVSCDADDPLPGNGNTGFFGVPSGDYTLTQSTVPEGTSPIDEREVTIEAGDNPNLIVNPAAGGGVLPIDDDDEDDGDAGTVLVDTSAVGGQGVCVELNTTGGIGFANPPVGCDNGEGDENDQPGQIELSDVPPGDYVLRVTSGAAGIPDQPVNVSETGPTQVTLGQPEPTETPTPTATPEPQPGNLTIALVDQDGQPIGGACWQLLQGDTVSAESCDTPEQESAQFANNGNTGFFDIPAGDYTLRFVSGPEGISVPDRQVTVAEDGDDTVTVATETPEPTTGTVTITFVDASGAPVGGPCVDLTNPSGTFNFCDDGDGLMELEDVAFGTQTIAPVSVPEGYALPAEQTVDLSAEQLDAEVQFTLEQATGNIRVTTVDPDGAPLAGACVAIDGGEPVCDVDNDGILNFADLAVGEHNVAQTTAPAGYQPVDSQAATVEDGATADVVFTNARDTGNVRVVSRDPGGTPLPGACVAIDGGEPVCDVDGDGVLSFEGLAVGEHTVSQTTSPEGYLPVEDQVVTVTSGETAEMTFTNAPATGAIVATVLDDDDNPVEGACVSVSAEGFETQSLCEAGEGGTYRFDGLNPGTYIVSVSQVPDQYVAPDPVEVDVTAGQDATVAFELSDAPPQTGNALLTLLSEDGQAAPGVCVALVNQETSEQLGPFCDNTEGQDGDGTEGVILLQGIPVGSYEVIFPDAGASSRQGLQADGPIVIEIIAGQTIEIEIVVPGLVLLGSIQIRTVDDATGNPVPGACYTIGTSDPVTVCDGGDGDGSADDGTVLVSGVQPGEYPVSIDPPDGYGGAADQTANVTSGATVTLTFRIDAEVTTGTITIRKLDGAGDALPGACFRLENTGGTVAQACDEADGDSDGTITMTDVPAGTYTLVETRVPGSEYSPAPNRTVEIVAGETLELEVTNTAAPGRLHVIKVDAADPSVRLDDACFRLDGATTYGPFCDGDDLSVDGRTVFGNVIPGTYTLVETQSPAGYDPAPDREVTIRAGVTLQITVQNQKTPPPPEAGTLVVHKLDENEDSLAGGCFRLFDGDTPVTAQICDITDGTNDGRIVFENVPVGTWTLRETLAPSPSYRLAPDQQVEIRNQQTTEVDVVNQLKDGRILIKKVTPQGGPIEGACFRLEPSIGDPICSGANGQILFENVPVGTWTLVETTVPFGFRQAGPVEGVKVNPGQTTVVRVENEREAPPNTGTVQIRKFTCPVATADEERTSFLGGAAGNAELARTQGCSPSDAGFTMVGQDGQDGPGAFRTGDDGHYQVTVPAKVYRLDETDPDLPGNSAALLRVEVGRMTTVVVINYVAPPAPEPVTITAVKYTCQAGFNGTTFEDFAASCMSPAQLTNNITIRAEGPLALKAVTGDGGQVGRTAFVDQPSGTWTIYEERPYNIPTNYVFCGWNANWPADFKSVNGAITAELGEGATLHCVMFNIPEPVTDSTGVILVRKYVCDVETPPKGYNFEQECRLSDELATFELKQYNEETTEYGEGTRQTANPDGILRFIDLRPGSYQLREVDNNWCYANSNSVNTRGDVVVRAGQVSLVSIYNCVGTSAPPNTGSGDAAGLLNPPEPDTPVSGENRMTPGVAWPVLILAAVAALWPRRVLSPGRDWRVDDEAA